MLNTGTESQCKLCGEIHPLEYLDAVNGDTHLIYRCDQKAKITGNPKHLKTVFLPKIFGLDIKHTIRKKDIESYQPAIPKEQLSLILEE